MKELDHFVSEDVSRVSPAGTFQVDLDLVQKYSVPAPRYTSYPPATQFTENISSGLLLENIRRNNETTRPLSLYFHLPFCRSLCWYCGCTTVITTQQEQSAAYLRYVEKELEWMRRRLNPQREVVQVHLGGGTPTFLLPDEIRRLGGMIRERMRFADELEASVEIDPRGLTRDHVAALREAGFSRASLGVQDHNPTVQRAVHRTQPFAQTKMAVDWLRRAGFKSLNIDLIYGLPFQTPATFERTLEEVLWLKPDRFAVFSYAHVPWMKPAQRLFNGDALPSPETKLAMLKLTIETLTAAGYDYIGMDHFARPQDELCIAQRCGTLRRNFQGYSTCGDADIYSFGISSISQTPEIYWQNHKELPRYYAALDAGEWPMARGAMLTGDDKLRRETIMRLMCDMGLDFEKMTDGLGVAFEEYFAPELESLEDLELDGLIERSQAGITVTDAGRLLIRIIAARFDAYLPAQKAEGRFSKAI
jgi:oxygen-independent coproporphyrinogen III oxidase